MANAMRSDSVNVLEIDKLLSLTRSMFFMGKRPRELKPIVLKTIGSFKTNFNILFFKSQILNITPQNTIYMDWKRN